MMIDANKENQLLNKNEIKEKAIPVVFLKALYFKNIITDEKKIWVNEIALHLS